jgi:hypothetical protein
MFIHSIYVVGVLIVKLIHIVHFLCFLPICILSPCTVPNTQPHYSHFTEPYKGIGFAFFNSVMRETDLLT